MKLQIVGCGLALMGRASLARALSTAAGVGSLPNVLSNKFFGMRHGNSEANAAGEISSNPSVATVKHGLTELGERQVSVAERSEDERNDECCRPRSNSSRRRDILVCCI